MARVVRVVRVMASLRGQRSSMHFNYCAAWKCQGYQKESDKQNLGGVAMSWCLKLVH